MKAAAARIAAPRTTQRRALRSPAGSGVGWAEASAGTDRVLGGPDRHRCIEAEVAMADEPGPRHELLAQHPAGARVDAQAEPDGRGRVGARQLRHAVALAQELGRAGVGSPAEPGPGAEGE